VVLLAGIIVALSIGIVVAGVPYIPHPPGTIAAAETHDVPSQPSNSTTPGTYPVRLSNLPGGSQFAIGVTVTNGVASFCVEREAYYLSWSLNSQFAQGGLAFQYDNCIVMPKDLAQTTLRFTTTVTDNWDVVAINDSPSPITVEFSPAA
jgi:hypothetical protein